MSAPLIRIEGLTRRFQSGGGLLARPRSMLAVNDVSLTIARGEAVGVVGESGCGKSTLARLVLRLIEPTAGRISFDGAEITTLAPAGLRRMRRRMAMVFQDPYSSLDPRYTVAEVLAEPFRIQRQKLSPEAIPALLASVGLPDGLAASHPHQLSGGQRQRVGIARALALHPEFLVLDEPTASLDVSIQAQIIALLADLRDRLGLTYLFISHDLSMVRHIADRVAVMYLGRIAELSPRDDLYARPLHPYAEALLSAVNEPDPVRAQSRQRIILMGDVPSPANPPVGCNFCTRCPKVFDRCRVVKPDLREVEPGRFVACHLFDQPDNKTRVAGSTGASEAPEHSKMLTNQQGVTQ